MNDGNSLHLNIFLSSTLPGHSAQRFVTIFLWDVGSIRKILEQRRVIHPPFEVHFPPVGNPGHNSCVSDYDSSLPICRGHKGYEDLSGILNY